MDNMDVDGQKDLPATQPVSDSIPKDRVELIVKGAKQNAAESVRRELEAKYGQELEQLRAQVQAQQPERAAQAQAPQMQDEDMLTQRVLDNLLQKAQEAQAEKERQQQMEGMKKTADQYFLKMGKGAELFDDFEDVMQDFQPEAFPNLVFLANEFENTPEIMYELSKNPQKLAEIDVLATKAPLMAKRRLKELSESIAFNKSAKEEYVAAPSPMSRLKSSAVGADKVDKNSWEYFHKHPNLPGRAKR